MASQRALAQKYIQLLGLKSVVVTFEPDNIGRGEIFYHDGKYWDPSMAAISPEVERLTFQQLDERVTEMFDEAKRQMYDI